METLQGCVTSRYEPTKMTAIKTWQTDITAAAASSVSRRPFSLCFRIALPTQCRDARFIRCRVMVILQIMSF